MILVEALLHFNHEYWIIIVENLYKNRFCESEISYIFNSWYIVIQLSMQVLILERGTDQGAFLHCLLYDCFKGGCSPMDKVPNNNS